MAQPAFKQFDIVTDHSDHHYSNVESQGKGNNNNSFINGSRTYKDIMRERKILDNNLPDTIYMRAYESRVDLMRAVIIGAAGTPYEDGLFFFDIKFPDDYPGHPPKVHYRSHGTLVNSVLAPNGRIFLSLFNNWFGWRSERWNSSKSTILQVLVSIQALIHEERPCVYDLTLGFHYKALKDVGKHGYDTYQGTLVFAATCLSTLYLLFKPPTNFESFVSEHFRQKAGGILRACRDLPEDFITDLRISIGGGHYTTVEVFYPRLVEAFRKNGSTEEELQLPVLKDEEMELWTMVEKDFSMEADGSTQPANQVEWNAKRSFLRLFSCLPWFLS